MHFEQVNFKIIVQGISLVRLSYLGAVHKLCRQKWGVQSVLLPDLSAIVRVSLKPTPPSPPFVTQCQHIPNPLNPLCQLCQILPNPLSLFSISFVNIFNATLFLNYFFLLLNKIHYLTKIFNV